MWLRGVGAERALLGAVLLDPAGQQRALDLVQADDMCRPWNAQVLGAMRRIGERGALPDPLAVYRELQNDPDLPPSAARDAVPLAELMEAAPRARHAPAYAVMVAESGIRNRLWIAGCRMVQASETGELEAAWRMAAQAHDEVDACMARWLALPAPLRRELRGETMVVAATPGSQRAEAQIPRPGGEKAATAGGAAVRDLAAAPARLALVRGWLRPEHFARPEDGALYAVMRDMDVAGMPVDPVTISWEAARHGVEAGPESLTGGMGPFAETSAREVYRHAQLAYVTQTGRDIQSGAISSTSSPRQLLQMAGDRLRTLETEVPPRTVPVRENAHPLPGRAAAAQCAAPEPEREAAQ
jgi:replicative DNA helicase